MHWQSVPETLAVGIIVLVFLSIYRKRRSTCTRNWIAGWIFIGVHFACQTFTPDQPGLALTVAEILSLSALAAAGTLFFVATIELTDDSRAQLNYAVSIVVPLVLYIVLFEVYPRPMLLEAAVAMEFVALFTFWCKHVREFDLYSCSLLLGAILTCSGCYYGVVRGNLELPMIMALTGLYCFTGLTYWHRYKRRSAGVLLAVVGFLAWGSAFTFAELLEVFRPGLIPESSSMWNIPKYFVAAAMILTLLEEEIIRAKQLTRRYQLQFDRSLCGVYRCTEDGRILECNDAFAQIFQRRREELEAAKLTELLAGKDGSGGAFLGQLAKQSQVMGVEFAITTDTGAARYLIGNATLTDSPEGPREIEGTILDITEFKNLQDQIRDSQKLEALGRLAGGVAHDFNNLLMVISGHMELLEDMVGSDPQTRAKLDAVRIATERGAAITGQLLAFSRKRPTEAKLLDVGKLLADTRTLLLPVVGESITLEIKPGEGCFDVLADENQLTLVLLNMVINARDAMPDGGRLVLESSSVELDESLAKVHGLEPAQYVCVSVSDTGCGIPPEVKARVFEPFYTTKPQGKGTGLGLSICYGIIRQHHGTIAIASSPGIGTTVSFYLPMATGSASAAQEPLSHTARGRSARILLVDDEEMLRKPASAFFQNAGFHVVEASSGQEALLMFDSEEFDLVITDMVMPGMNGKQLGAELKQRSPGLPIIYISGYAQDILESQGQLAPGDILLQKPYSLKKLVNVVEDEIEKLGEKSA
jgi:PAS domain S-box-containing protein